MYSKTKKMRIIKRVSELKSVLNPLKEKQQKSVGFVPTMGALHAGHLSLVSRCIAENDVCVVSIFVNPTQFNNKEDLRLYPRTLGKDAELLQELGVHYVFAPDEQEMYPEPDTRVFDFGVLTEVMEGAFRPGHFNGVAQVVSKLFDMVQPDRAYFGEKDFQQLAIIRAMVKQLNIPVEIVGVPIVREKSGLAMSSRNMRLSDTQRQHATAIYYTLRESAEMIHDKNPDQIIRYVKETINEVDDLQVEYFDIADAETLQSISAWDETEQVVGCIAVFCGEVRLIDNIRYK